MRLLDRYLLRELLVPLGYCLTGFFVFWVTFDLVAQLDEFQRRELLPGDIAAYYLVKTPEVLVTVVPVGLMLALLYALTQHARHQELTAMRAAGLSLWRLSVPHLGVGIVLGAALFGLNEYAVPDANDAASLVLGRRLPPAPGALGPEWEPNLAFHNERDQRLWNILAYNRETGEMRSPHLEWRLADGTRRRLVADRAVYTNEVWLFYEVKELLYPPQATLPSYRGETNILELADLTETPERIASEIKFTELSNVRAAKRPRLSLRELQDYQRLHPQLGERDRSKLQTQFHGRIAEPWKCVVVVLIALPFGAPSGRRNVLVGVASSIFIGFAYFIISSFSLALGTGGFMPPWLAAWLPNALFALAGVVLTRRLP
ncbi:MAG TPA: LptF/LptG family permease [Verrucomicrobiota bacterium]|nr:LptF/LptG family permease [Verrucomicrobiota bacterium]HNU50804.1 LptF/LptG family permease [Verrucomicrobiota bacterium]